MSYRNYTYIIIILFAFTCFTKCISDPVRPSWETDNITPIFNTSLRMEDFISDTLLNIASDGQMSILFSYNLYNLSFDTLLNVPDTLTNNSWHFPFYYLAPPGQILFDTTSIKRMRIGDVQLTKIKVKSGSVNLSVSNTVARDVLFTYTIKCASINNIPFQTTLTIPAAANNKQGYISTSYDASGYVFDLSGTTFNNYNTFISKAKAQIDPTKDTVLLTPNDSTVIYTRLKDLRISEARGYFGQDKITIGPEYTNFDFFKSILGGSIGLENLKLKFEVTNGIGLDAQLIIKELSSYNSKSNTKVLLKGGIANSPLNITRAKETGVPFYPFAPTVKTFDFSNSNFKELIENLPNQIGYTLQIITNPMGNVSSGNDFIFENSSLNAALTLELPLSGKANNIAFSKNIQVNFKSKQTQKLKEANLILEVNNGFPFDGNVQLYMLNNQHVIIDSVFPQSYIASAILDINQKVSEKKTTVYTIPLNAQRISNINNTTDIIVKALINTPSTGKYVRIYNDYSIDVNLKGSFKYLIDTKKQ